MRRGGGGGGNASTDLKLQRQLVGKKNRFSDTLMLTKRKVTDEDIYWYHADAVQQ
jgi:hypothetical protein